MSESIPMPDLWTPATATVQTITSKAPEAVLSPSNESSAQSSTLTLLKPVEAAQQPVQQPVLGKTANDYERPVKVVSIMCVHLIKHLVKILLVDDRPEYAGLSPEAKVLAIQLATLWDAHEHTGVICPPAGRLMAWNGWTESQLRSATLELAMAGLYRVRSDSRGGISIYVPLFLDDAQRLSKATNAIVRASLDHYVYLSRYSGLSSTARLVSLYSASRIKTVWHDLGYVRGNHQSGYKINGVRQVRATLFDHPLMRAKSPEDIRLLAELDELWPQEVMPKVFRTQVVLADMLRIAGGQEEWNAVQQELTDSGYWSYEAKGTSLVFTPLMRLHQAVWDLNMLVGGTMRNDFEVWNKFLPTEDTDPEGDDPYLHRPPLGYHWLYILKFGHLRQVGESTQPLQRRAQQHCQSPTNAFAEKHITLELRQGCVPEIEFAGVVHHSEAAAAEMELLQRVREQGFDVSNAITDARSNRRTIKKDRRFEGMGFREVHEALEASKNPGHPSAQLAQRLNASGAVPI